MERERDIGYTDMGDTKTPHTKKHNLQNALKRKKKTSTYILNSLSPKEEKYGLSIH